MQSFIGSASKRKKRRYPGSNRATHIAEVRERITRQNWKDMKVGRLVALYWICHEKIYGVVPAEIDKTAVWEQVMKAAGGMVKNEFDGDMQQAIEFMRWVWTDEARKENWRRANHKPAGRIKWQNQFLHGYLISDWRAAVMRRRAT